MTKLDIPSAFKAFTTVQMLAPVAKYASGTVSTQLNLNGSLGKNMLPLFQGLTGKGALQTANIALHDFPAMEKLVDVTKLQILNNPTMQAIRTSFQIHDGRLFVDPFPVKIGPLTMQVAGSNGLDQSLNYKLDLQVPRTVLGGGANQAIASLASQAGRAGINIGAAPEIPLGVQLGGSVTNPVVKVDVGTLTSSVTQGATQAVKQAVTAKVDSAKLRLVEEAERRAAAIRTEAESLAAKVKQTGYQQADALVSQAGDNPLAAAGAKVAADKLRQESDDKAQGIISEASKRADSLVAAAKR
jgi:AsmA-like C-terminal region